LLIDVELGKAETFTRYEIIDGNKIKFSIAPSENVKPYPYNIKIGLT